ncbi:acyltransferase family protein [Eionea flava]
MKSSSGKYFIGLDHIRAAAAFLVFTWHFIHVNKGNIAAPPIFPLSLLTEGHTGVGLFMVLSGYLFAKLLNGKKILYGQFIWNRCLRLLPLLIVVIFIVGLRKYWAGDDIINYAKTIFSGILMPSLPNGGWSITVEFHFYLLLPALLLLTHQWRYSLLLTVGIALLLRTWLHHDMGQIQTLSYWTIVGRIDQFTLGILAFYLCHIVTEKHAFVLCITLLFAIFYWYFDSLGGFYAAPSYPSPSSIWIYMPTLEGVTYAIVIAWYDTSFRHTKSKTSSFFARIGTYSYSIYLLHFFIVFKMATIIDTYIINLSNIYLAITFAIPCFLLMIPIGYMSHRFIETPFLRYRTKYIIHRE